MDDIHLATKNFFKKKHYYMDSKAIVGMDQCCVCKLLLHSI